MIQRLRRLPWRVLARDATGIAGAATSAYGAGLIFPPAGYLVAGVLMMSVAALLARSS